MSTLKEKFETKASIDTTNEAKVFAKECEKIADDYAIEFLLFEQKAFSGKIMNYEYAKAMLETFKKEKGL
jgi:hypothetical protein